MLLPPKRTLSSIHPPISAGAIANKITDSLFIREVHGDTPPILEKRAACPPHFKGALPLPDFRGALPLLYLGGAWAPPHALGVHEPLPYLEEHGVRSICQRRAHPFCRPEEHIPPSVLQRSAQGDRVSACPQEEHGAPLNKDEYVIIERSEFPSNFCPQEEGRLSLCS